MSISLPISYPLCMVPEYEGIYKTTPLSFCVPKGWNDVYNALKQFIKEKELHAEIYRTEAIYKIVCQDPYCEFRIYAHKYMVLYDNEYDIILSFDLLKGDAAHMTFIMNTLHYRLVESGESNYSTVNQQFGFENLL